MKKGCLIGIVGSAGLFVILTIIGVVVSLFVLGSAEVIDVEKPVPKAKSELPEKPIQDSPATTQQTTTKELPEEPPKVPTIFDQRQWTSSDGQRTLNGKLTKMSEGQVIVEKNGNEIIFSIENFSEADKRFLGQGVTIRTIDGKTHENGSVTRISADSIDFKNSSGSITIPMEDLPANLQHHFAYNPVVTNKALGIHELNNDEQAKLNTLLKQAIQMEMTAESRPKPNDQFPEKAVAPVAVRAVSSPVFITKIDDRENDVLTLANGSVVETRFGFLGFIGFRKDAVLYKEGTSWKIWIEGKRSFSCGLLKNPDDRPSGEGELVSIYEIIGGGKYLTTFEGALYEVGALDTIETALWLGPFEALLIDENRLLNLEEGGKIIGVTKVR